MATDIPKDRMLAAAIVAGFVLLVALGFWSPVFWFFAFLGIPMGLAVRNQRRFRGRVTGKALRTHQVQEPDAVDLMWIVGVRVAAVLFVALLVYSWMRR